MASRAASSARCGQPPGQLVLSELTLYGRHADRSCLPHPKRPQELAHLYHYYLHGEQGNRGSGGKKERLPNGEPFPDILLRYQVPQLLIIGAAHLLPRPLQLLLAFSCHAVTVPPLAFVAASLPTSPTSERLHRLHAGGCSHGVAAAAGGGG